MKIKLVIILLIITAIFVINLNACGHGQYSAYAGKYMKGSFYITLNSDGTFEASNYMSFSGKYSVKGENVEFKIENMNGKSLSNTAEGKLKGNELTGPDGIIYTKS